MVVLHSSGIKLTKMSKLRHMGGRTNWRHHFCTGRFGTTV